MATPFANQGVRLPWSANEVCSQSDCFEFCFLDDYVPVLVFDESYHIADLCELCVCAHQLTHTHKSIKRRRTTGEETSLNKAKVK